MGRIPSINIFFQFESVRTSWNVFDCISTDSETRGMISSIYIFQFESVWTDWNVFDCVWNDSETGRYIPRFFIFPFSMVELGARYVHFPFFLSNWFKPGGTILTVFEPTVEPGGTIRRFSIFSFESVHPWTVLTSWCEGTKKNQLFPFWSRSIHPESTQYWGSVPSQILRVTIDFPTVMVGCSLAPLLVSKLKSFQWAGATVQKQNPLLNLHPKSVSLCTFNQLYWNWSNN